MKDGALKGEEVLKKVSSPFAVGRKESFFRERYFYVDEYTLKPTPETSGLVDLALEKLKEFPSDQSKIIVDVGTGSGNIGISIALDGEKDKVICLDLSAEALEVAATNIERYGLGERVTLHQGDLFAPLEKMGIEGKVTLIVSNPPFIPTASIPRMDPEIRDRQPLMALNGGPFGIDVIVRLVEEGYKYLKNGGWLLFEFGKGQEKMVDRIVRKYGMYEAANYFPLIDPQFVAMKKPLN
jgi:release factor glutamine methyltransferase